MADLSLCPSHLSAAAAWLIRCGLLADEVVKRQANGSTAENDQRMRAVYADLPGSVQAAQVAMRACRESGLLGPVTKLSEAHVIAIRTAARMANVSAGMSRNLHRQRLDGRDDEMLARRHAELRNEAVAAFDRACRVHDGVTT